MSALNWLQSADRRGEPSSPQPLFHPGELTDVDEKENWPELYCFFGGAAGIEPAPKMAVTCGNAGLGYAKVREMTCGYAKRVDDINTACGHPRRAAHRRVNEGQEQLCIA